jgi:hypothetical protein
MAVRLPLIISQAARRDASAAELVEKLVAEAMFIAGVDASLIGALDTIAHGSTDHLCLQGNARDIVLVGWLDLPAAVAAWQRLQLDGTFYPLQGSSPAHTTLVEQSVVEPDRTLAPRSRSVLYFQLTPATGVPQVLGLCRARLAALQVPLVGLQSLTKPRPATPVGSTAPGTVAVGLSEPVRPTVALPISSPTLPTSPLPTLSAPQPVGVAFSNGYVDDAADDDFANLDQLVDDLDAMDL